MPILGKRIRIEDKSVPESFLEIKNHVGEKRIIIFRDRYVENLSEKRNLQNWKPVYEPVVTSKNATDDKSLTDRLYESDSPVFWRTAKQRSISLSTCELEYMVLSALAQELLFLKPVFESVNYKTTLPILFSDNQGAICVAHETASRSWAIHIDIKVHFFREQVRSAKVTLKYRPTTIMVADILTKGLPRNRLTQICKLLVEVLFEREC